MSLREFTTAPPRREASTPSAPAVFDLLRFCIFTTLAVLAWLLGPAVMVTATSAAGLAAYWRAWRAGLTRSRCVLGDTRLVMAYLAACFIAGAASLIYRFLRG